MTFEQPVPDAVRLTLARLGTRIEYTERDPGGIVNLAESEVTNDVLRPIAVAHDSVSRFDAERELVYQQTHHLRRTLPAPS